jgi:hypothetical protein
MIFRCVALLFGAFALAGCCVSGNGCYAPVSGTPVALDRGAPVSRSADIDDYKPRRKVSPKPEIAAAPLDGISPQRNAMAQSGDHWEREQAADREAEAALARQLMICRGC